MMNIRNVFTGEDMLPWSQCDPAWADDCCSETTKLENGSLLVTTSGNCSKTPQLSEQQYWTRRVLNMTNDFDITNLGEVRYELFGCLVIAWVVCYCCIWKGVKSTGKAAYVTATFPLVMLVILGETILICKSKRLLKLSIKLFGASPYLVLELGFITI